MAYYIGIDAGGTKTACALANGDDIIARSSGPSSKLQAGRERATSVLGGVVDNVLQTSGVSGESVVACCLGISGASDPSVTPWANEVLGRRMKGTIQVVGDQTIAIEAAFQGGPGVVVIAGTGSIAVGRNDSGKIARAGGKGPANSDEGSGQWIVRKAAELGSTDMLLSVAALMGGAKPDYTRMAALFPIVLEAAEQGDEAAIKALERGGIELGKLALGVLGELWSAHSEVTVRGVGGVLRNSPEVSVAMAKTLAADWPEAKYDREKIDPVEGALYLARQIT